MKMKNYNNLGLEQTNNLYLISFFGFGLNIKWPLKKNINILLGINSCHQLFVRPPQQGSQISKLTYVFICRVVVQYPRIAPLVLPNQCTAVADKIKM